MFCIKCGKELDEGAQYCSGCGTAVGEKGTIRFSINVGKTAPDFLMKSEDNLFYLILMSLATIIIMVSGFFPIIECKIGVFGWYIASDKWSLFEIWKNIAVLEAVLEDAITSSEIITIKVVIGMSLLCYAICVVMGCFFLKGLLTGKRKRDFTMWASAVSVSSEIAFIIIFFVRFRINQAASSFYYSNELFRYTIMGWILLFLPVANYIISKQYLGKNKKIENHSITKEKICLLCKTSYIIGNKCPKCGSTATEEL